MKETQKISFTKSNFQSYFDKYFKALVGFAHKFLQDLDASEDMVQEVFVTLWEKQMEFENETAFKAYLYRAVRNKSLNIIRKDQVKERHQQEALLTLDQEESFLDHVLSEEVSRLLYHFIEELPSKRQQVVRYSMLGLRNQEIADIMGVKLNTVKAQKLHAYKELREKMGEHAYLITILLGMNI